MKHLYLLVLLIFCSIMAISQNTTHTVDGKEISLTQDTKGPLTLFWTTINQEYRYFIQKDGEITELTNTKVDGKYGNQYRDQLSTLSSDFPVETSKVKLTLASLRKFANDYNTKADPDFTPNSTVVKPTYRIGGFVGLTNSVFTDNPTNASNGQLGIDFEILDEIALPRHSFVLQYKQTLSSDEFDFNSSQFSINYRFKFVKTDAIDVFVNTKLATLTFSSRGDFETVENGMTVLEEGDSATNFQGPFLFGLGADIAIGNGYLMLNYHDAFSFFLDDNGEFPTDFSVGYKFSF